MPDPTDPIALSVKGVSLGAQGRDLQIEIARIVGKRSREQAAEFVKSGKLPVLARAKNSGTNSATLFLTKQELAVLRGTSPGQSTGGRGSSGSSSKNTLSGAVARNNSTSGTSSTKTGSSATARVADVANPGLLAQLLQSEEVLSFGRVQPAEGTNIYDIPDTTKGKKTLYERNTRVFVCRKLPGDWYFVRLDNGDYGYVNSHRVWINPPDPKAYLYRIQKDEGAQAIAKQEFLKQAASQSGASPIQWGMDWRHYVRVLVYANQGPKNGSGLRGIAYANKAEKWDETKTTEGVDIWIPSLEFAQSLKGKLPSDSVSYNVYQAVVKHLGTVGDFLLGHIAFEAGIVHGALESLWDLVTGLVDLVKLVWDILESIFTGSLFSDLKGLWELVTSLKPSQLIEAGIKSFLSKWNHPNFFRRWHFRGWVVGYALAEILMAVITGAASLVKWAGKAGKISKLIAKFPKVLKLAEKVTEVSKRIPDEALKRLKKVVSRTPDEVPLKNRKYVPWSGWKYIGNAEEADKAIYAKIREILHDGAFLLKMNKNTGISRRILERVHKHLFHTMHEVAVAANKMEKGYFAPDPDIAELWTKAMKGKMTGPDVERFRRLMAHEYVESKLMEKGLPYRSPHQDAWDAEGVSRFTTKHHGAHDLAPHVDPTRPPLAHWKFVLGVDPPDFKLADDLNNLDNLIQDILKIKRGWK